MYKKGKGYHNRSQEHSLNARGINTSKNGTEWSKPKTRIVDIDDVYDDMAHDMFGKEFYELTPAEKDELFYQFENVVKPNLENSGHKLVSYGNDTDYLSELFKDSKRIKPSKISEWDNPELIEGDEDMLREFLTMRRANIPADDPAWKSLIFKHTRIATEMSKRKIKPAKSLEQVKHELADELNIDKSEFDLPSHGIEESGRYPKQRGSAFQISHKEYGRRKYRAVPLVEVTPYNKRKLSKANIWYTTKSTPDGRYMIHILPEDMDKVSVRPTKRRMQSEHIVEVK